MLLTADCVVSVFTDLITQKIDREFVDRWAYERISAFDAGDVNFEPADQEDRIWASILFLYGIDLQTSPGEYMHSLGDIERKFGELWKIKKYISSDLSNFEWHDCRLYGIKLLNERYILSFDIDYISKWHESDAGYTGFDVTPSVLTFFNVSHLDLPLRISSRMD